MEMQMGKQMTQQQKKIHNAIKLIPFLFKI